jgi:hypothetical protein
MQWALTSNRTAVARNNPYVFRLAQEGDTVYVFVGYEEPGSDCRFVHYYPVEGKDIRAAMKYVSSHVMDVVHMAWTGKLGVLQTRLDHAHPAAV